MTTDHEPARRTSDGVSLTPTLEMVHRHVVSQPDALAMIAADGSGITFGQLWSRAEQTASTLRIEHGEIVGVRLPRSVEFVVAIIAVQLAGGVYAPFSPDDPEARTLDLQQRIGVRSEITVEHGELSVQTLRDSDPAVLDMSGSPADRPIYVMWTSGSTGGPKAVVIPHRGVLRLIHDRSLMDIRPEDRLAFASNTMFDAATWEVWASLGNGAALVVIDGDDLVDAGRLRTRLEASRVTLAFITTSLFNHLTRSDGEVFSTLHSVAVGGEALSPSVLRRVLASGSAPGAVLNVYGPTECTTFATCSRIVDVPVDAARIPIGSPILGTELAVVDASGEPVADGEEGELWIAGDGVAIGYLGDDERQDRFVSTALPGCSGTRWYRTGDLATRLPDGTIDCLGRIDRQIKVHGYRIEPSEIEQTIESHPGVRATAVIAQRSGSTVRLLGFVVADEAGLDTDITLSELRRTLPAFMVPTRLVTVDHLPTTANGKLDEHRLVELATLSEVGPVQEGWREALLHPADRFALECARTVLGMDHLQVDDDLWAAGLDSLSAIELLDMLADGEYGTFDTPEFQGLSTAEQMGRVLRRGGGARDDAGTDPTAVVLNRGGHLPPIFAVPGAAGTSSIYRPLAQALGEDRPIIVIGPRGMHRAGPVDRTIEAAAEHVCAVIEGTLDPREPCVLLGYSSGASIAFEVARLLDARGVEVRLVMLDAMPGVTDGPELAAVRPHTYILPSTAPPVKPERGLFSRARARRRAHAERRRVQRFVDDPGPPSFETERYEAFLRIARAAVARFEPEPAPFPATLIRVDLGPIERLGAHLVPHLEVHVVGGDHATMLSRRHVHEVAAVLEPILVSVRTSHGDHGPRVASSP